MRPTLNIKIGLAYATKRGRSNMIGEAVRPVHLCMPGAATFPVLVDKVGARVCSEAGRTMRIIIDRSGGLVIRSGWVGQRVTYENVLGICVRYQARGWLALLGTKDGFVYEVRLRNGTALTVRPGTPGFRLLKAFLKDAGWMVMEGEEMAKREPSIAATLASRLVPNR